MKNLKYYIITLVALLGVDTVQAQMQNDNLSEVRQYLNSMFQQLNKNLVPTGYLLDYGIDLVDMEDYEGMVIADSTAVNMGIYRDLLRTISSSNVHNQGFYNSIKTRLDEIEEQSSENNIVLSAALYKYNVIKDNAIEDNLIVYDEVNNKVLDVYNNGVWVNPYDTKYLFAFVGGKQVINGFAVTYTLPNTLIFKNEQYSNLMFDAGDGAGYRLLVPGTLVNITYSSGGIKTLKLKLRNVHGDYLEANTYVYVKEPSIHILGGGIYVTKPYGNEFDGETVRARISYNPQNGQILKPFIVVEGFDPWNFKDYSDEELQQNEAYWYPGSDIKAGFNHYHNYKDIFNNLYEKYGYNVIYIDWENCEADIRANAQLLQDIITDINTMKMSNGSNEKNIVLGLSMGGLISRYALCTMEQNGLKHQTKAYVSGDAPHLGVNVPVGYQVFINQFLSLFYGYDHMVDIWSDEYNDKLSDDEKVIKQYITSDSARQMMYCYASNNNIIDNSPEYLNLQSELYRLGFPKGDDMEGIALLAIANNGEIYDCSALNDSKHLLAFDGKLQGKLFKDIVKEIIGDQFEKEFVVNCLSWVVDNFNIGKAYITAEVNPFQEANLGKTLSSLKVQYKKKLLGNKYITHEFYNSNVTVPMSALYYEDFIGSIYSIDRKMVGMQSAQNSTSEQLIDNLSVPTIDYNNGVYNFTWTGDISGNLKLRDKVLFVPTASALCIGNNFCDLTMADYTTNYLQDPTCCNFNTPFHSYMIDTSSSHHTTFSDEAFYWIVRQTDMEIDGPGFIQDCGVYTVLGVDDSDANIEWSVSDKSIAEISSNGELQKVNDGIVQITAKSYQNGKLYLKTKTVVVGFPDFVITKKFIVGEGYRFSAILVDNPELNLSDIVASDEICYEWSIIDGDGTKITEVTSESTFSYLPETDEAVTVVLRIIDINDNHTSDIRSITFNLNTPFAINYKYIVVNQYGSVFFIMDDTGDDPVFCVGVPTEKFTIDFRNLIMNQTDNTFTLMSKYIKGNMCYLNCYDLLQNRQYRLSGTKKSLYLQWYYDLFDQAFIIDGIEQAIEHTGWTREAIAEYNIIIENSAYEALQCIPFKIIYNPMFGL